MYEARVMVPTQIDALFECARNGIPGPVIAFSCDEYGEGCGFPHVQAWCDEYDDAEAYTAFMRWGTRAGSTLLEVAELPTR